MIIGITKLEKHWWIQNINFKLQGAAAPAAKAEEKKVEKKEEKKEESEDEDMGFGLFD
jgi:ribosomal protein L12E/L44/L45/RPP1/RPP2